MEKQMTSRENAYELLKEFNKSDSLIKHGLAVEAVMLHFAEILNETDIEKWGVIGLLHDLDYEMYPDQHCVKAREILSSRNWPEAYIHAVECHGWKSCVDVKPEEKMEKVLYTIDELTGLITATVLMRPSKSVLDLETKSVKKKWKTKGFAAGVNRDIIEEGAALLGMDIDYIIDESIKGMQKRAELIGLMGEL
jgi:putative nucleotidyltransferase with HDIG domain